MLDELDIALIRVQADWKACCGATVRASDLREVHWRQPDDLARSLMHGFIDCSTIVSGTLPHACDPGSAPHRIRVCVLKRHTLPTVYAELTRRAGDGHGH